MSKKGLINGNTLWDKNMIPYLGTNMSFKLRSIEVIVCTIILVFCFSTSCATSGAFSYTKASFSYKTLYPFSIMKSERLKSSGHHFAYQVLSFTKSFLKQEISQLIEITE